MPKFRTLKQINVKKKRALLRADLDVPLGDDLKIGRNERWRIETVIPTLKYLIKQKAKIILIGHLGRPNGKRDKRFSLKPVAGELEKILKKKVLFSNEIIGKKVEKKIKRMKFGDILMLENIRFHPGEEKNSPRLAKDLAKLGDVFINEAFATSHREHASIVGIPEYLPSVAGFHFEKEIKELNKILKNPKHPLMAIIGGAKISTKIKAISKFLRIADWVLIGGALANDIFAAQGFNMGKSKIDKESFEENKKINPPAGGKSPKLFLPIDLVSWDGEHLPVGETGIHYREINEVGDKEKVLDIGPKTIDLFSDLIKKAGTVVWNGPLGLIEQKPFDKSTKAIAEAIAKSRAYSVVGGGDTVAFIKQIKMDKAFNYLSTAGGAMLDYLANETLPGLESLLEALPEAATNKQRL